MTLCEYNKNGPIYYSWDKPQIYKGVYKCYLHGKYNCKRIVYTMSRGDFEALIEKWNANQKGWVYEIVEGG